MQTFSVGTKVKITPRGNATPLLVAKLAGHKGTVVDTLREDLVLVKLVAGMLTNVDPRDLTTIEKF